MRLVENLHREDLDPIDETEAHSTLRKMGINVSEISRLVPIRMEHTVYGRLVQITLGGGAVKLLKQAVERLLS